MHTADLHAGLSEEGINTIREPYSHDQTCTLTKLDRIEKSMMVMQYQLQQLLWQQWPYPAFAYPNDSNCKPSSHSETQEVLQYLGKWATYDVQIPIVCSVERDNAAAMVIQRF